MGIKGLLMSTKSIGKTKHLSEYRNKTVGIDGYAWLHKAVHRCGIEVSENKNIKGIVSFFEKKIKYLLNLKINIYLVFDGDNIPLKKQTNKNREKTRKKNHSKGLECLKQGNIKEAKKYIGLSVDINPEMVYILKKELEKLFPKKIQFLVAPYEADSQLAYLSKQKIIDFIITEDSDLLVFGALVIFYKMDTNYYGVEYKLENLELCEEINLKNWPFEKFIQLCILSGCDYLKNPKGIGFKTAYDLFNRHNNIKKVVNNIKDRINEQYYQQFLAAFCAFKFSRVFCPLKKRIVTLNYIDLKTIDLENAFELHAVSKSMENFSNLNFLGEELDVEIAKKIAFCEINPIDKKVFKGIYKSSSHKKNHTNLANKRSILKLELNDNLDYFIKNRNNTLSPMKNNKPENLQQFKVKNDLSLKLNPFKRIRRENSNSKIKFIKKEIKDDKEDLPVNSDVYFQMVDDLIANFTKENLKRRSNVENTLSIFRKALNN